MEMYYGQRPLSRSLEITILSGEDLRKNKRPIKKNAFVTVRSDSDNVRSTAVDEEGGSHPKWNEKLFLDAPAHAPSFTVEVRCKTAFGDKIVGSALVPATDFSGGYVPESCVHFLSYRLRSPSGERNGIINICVRTKGPVAVEDTCSAAAVADHRTRVGVPVGTHFGGVVTGVPVWVSHKSGSYF